MKKTSKLIVALLIILTIATISLSSFATQDDDKPQQLKPTDLYPDANTVVTGQTEIQQLGKQIVGVVQTVGIVIAVVILLVLGIKYMMGSAEEKADYKKSMIPYIVGAILIFASTTIVNIVYNLAIGLNTDTVG